MSSSPIPVLSEVLYYTPSDSYDYITDSRPLYNLDSNIRAVATAMVGAGYGEHTSISGGLLTPGRGVKLNISTGQIAYPVGSAQSDDILGIVIGATTAGLNKVIWSSGLLDLEALGLSGILADPVSGSYLRINSSTGVISALDSAPEDAFILGRVENWPYISVKTVSQNQAALSVTPSNNHHNLYGFNRLRNLLLYVDAGQIPIQYQKVTKYQSDYSGSEINPMSCRFSADLSSILAYGTTTVVYDASVLSSKILKEKYYPFISGSTGPNVSGSSWDAVAYSSTLTGGTKNYELEPIGPGFDFSTSAGSLSKFKDFYIEKYYQYAKVGSGSILSGKVVTTATVFNPPSPGLTHDQFFGGESSVIIVWDFYEYNQVTGLETTKYRVITNGSSATTLFDTTYGIFSDTLKNL